MKTLFVVLLIVFGVALVAVLLYFIIGNICYRLALKRTSIIGKEINKQMQATLAKYKINYKWWNKVKLEKWQHTTKDDIKLVARFLDNKSDKVVVVVHGYMTTYKEMQTFVKYFYSRGYSVLCPENRGHGESEGKSVGMGWKDKDDILDWLKILNKKFDKKIEICLFGLSMGGATVCMLSGMKLPKNVKCIISDCGYDCVYDQFKFVAHNYLKLPEFPVLPIYDSYNKLTQGFSLKEADAKFSLAKCKIPILFIHGDADEFVSVDCVKRMYDATPSDIRDIMIIKGAGHALCYAKDTRKYCKKLDEFLKKNF